MIVIGVDPHKSSHTVAALEEMSHESAGIARFEATFAGYRQLLDWAKKFASRRWAVENSGGLGRHLAQWLLARGETVVDVPATATARVRQLSRGHRKTDALDAAAAASVAAMRGESSPVPAEDRSTVLSMLDERRTNLTQQRTRTVNQLHALLRELLPSGAATDLSAEKAAEVLGRVRPACPVERARKELARELVVDVRRLDQRLADNRNRLQELVNDTDTSLTKIVGVGPVVAARLIGRTRSASRFHSASSYAAYCGTAPIEIASADKSRHRLSRHGDRKINSALHTIALTQIRTPGSQGKIYYDRKISEGKTHTEAMRCLRRRLAYHVWRTMRADEDRSNPQPMGPGAGPGGHPGATLASSATGPNPVAGSSDQSQPEPAGSEPTPPGHAA